MEWISVEDRLPELEHYIEDGMPTWAAPYVRIRSQAQCVDVTTGYYVPEDKMWFTAEEHEWISVTHWTPLSDLLEPSDARPDILDCRCCFTGWYLRWDEG